MAKRKVGSQISNLTPDNSKLGIAFISLCERWRATYHWKALNEGYNVTSKRISIRGLHTKLWAPKVTEIPTLGIWRFSLGSPGTKWHLGAGPVAKHRVYYKGEGGGFPQVQAMVNLVNLCLPVVCLCTKMLHYALTNLLFGLCRFFWVTESLVNFPSPILEL